MSMPKNDLSSLKIGEWVIFVGDWMFNPDGALYAQEGLIVNRLYQIRSVKFSGYVSVYTDYGETPPFPPSWFERCNWDTETKELYGLLFH